MERLQAVYLMSNNQPSLLTTYYSISFNAILHGRAFTNVVL